MALRAKISSFCKAGFSRLIEVERRQFKRHDVLLFRSIPKLGFNTLRGKLAVGTLAFASFGPLIPKVIAISASESQILQKADKLYADNDIPGVYELLLQYKDGNNDEILWRLARASCDMSKRSTSTTAKEHMYEALGYVKKALEINNNNWACHKWYAIILDYTKMYEGNRARIECAVECKEHLMKAHELNPKDATNIYCIGYWCFLFADLAWYERKIASVVYASPPTSTYEEALKYFLRAEEVDPNFYSKNFLMLGKTYLRLGDKSNAELYLRKAVSYYIKTVDDQDAHVEAFQLLKKMGVKLDH